MKLRFTANVSQECLGEHGALTRLVSAIRTVRDIGKINVDCSSIFHGGGDAAAAAAKLSTALRGASHAAIAQAAKHIVTAERLAVVAAIADEKLRLAVRDEVLPHVLRGLTISGEHMMPSSIMMAEAVRLKLVTPRAFTSTIESLLRDRSSRRAAVAVLGRLADIMNPPSDALLSAMTPLYPIMQQLTGLDPSLQYDLSFISRAFQWGPPCKSLSLTRRLPTQHHKSIVSMTHSGHCDELVTGSLDGAVVVWELSSPEDRAMARFLLPPSFIPVSMDTLNASSFVVACVAPAPATPMLRFLTRSGTDATWGVAETIERDRCTAITCVRGFPQNASLCCVTEVDGGAHNLFVLSVGTGQELRAFHNAHTDYITAAATAAEMEHTVLTGSCDGTTKLWDLRSSSSHPTCQFADSHHDAISTVSIASDAIVSGAVNRRVCFWDPRKLGTPLAERTLTATVLKVVLLHNLTVVVSTCNAMMLMGTNGSIEDVMPNVCYAELRGNDDGTVVFAAGNSQGATQSGCHVDVFRVHSS